MAKVIMKKWMDGMNKVSLTHLQMDILKKTLKESKTNVDLLLHNNEVILEINDTQIAKEFIERAREIGVVCLFLE